jgi:hypothetical protein
MQCLRLEFYAAYLAVFDIAVLGRLGEAAVQPIIHRILMLLKVPSHGAKARIVCGIEGKVKD